MDGFVPLRISVTPPQEHEQALELGVLASRDNNRVRFDVESRKKHVELLAAETCVFHAPLIIVAVQRVNPVLE
jgi:hypothetical protein